jgi:hypothetical protein
MKNSSRNRPDPDVGAAGSWWTRSAPRSAAAAPLIQRTPANLFSFFASKVSPPRSSSDPQAVTPQLRSKGKAAKYPPGAGRPTVADLPRPTGMPQAYLEVGWADC